MGWWVFSHCFFLFVATGQVVLESCRTHMGHSCGDSWQLLHIINQQFGYWGQTDFSSTWPSSVNFNHKTLTDCKLQCSSANGQKQFCEYLPAIRDFWFCCDDARRNDTSSLHLLIPLFLRSDSNKKMFFIVHDVCLQAPSVSQQPDSTCITALLHSATRCHLKTKCNYRVVFFLLEDIVNKYYLASLKH